MNVPGNVQDYLDKSGFDGLCSKTCHCMNENLAPNDDCEPKSCWPGYKIMQKLNNGGTRFVITPTKYSN